MAQWGFGWGRLGVLKGRRCTATDKPDTTALLGPRALRSADPPRSDTKGKGAPPRGRLCLG